MNINESTKNRLQELARIRIPKIPDQTYFDTLSSALDHAVEKTKERGFEVNQNDIWNFSVGGISYLQTKSGHIEITKDGIPQKKMLQIQIYRMDSGRYELNHYIA